MSLQEEAASYREQPIQDIEKHPLRSKTVQIQISRAFSDVSVI